MKKYPAISLKRRALETTLLFRKLFEPNLPLPTNPRSIFLLQPSHIGDLLVDTPFFQALRTRYPNAHIVLGTGPWNFPTIQGNPYLSEIFELPVPWNNSFVKPQSIFNSFKFIYSSPLVRQLRDRHFDLAIDLIGTQFNAILLMQMGVPYRLGIQGPGGGYSTFHAHALYDEYEPMARTALRLAEHLGITDLPSINPQIFLTDSEQQRGRQLWEQTLANNPNSRKIIIGPAATVPEKTWPLDSFRQLLSRLANIDDLPPVLVGGQDIVPACREFATLSPRILDLSGKLKLRETFALIAQADLVISNSNMLMHVAAAFGVPSIVVLGDLYDSAQQHKIQWGYPSTTVLGKEPARPVLATPDDVIDNISSILKLSGASVSS